MLQKPKLVAINPDTLKQQHHLESAQVKARVLSKHTHWMECIPDRNLHVMITSRMVSSIYVELVVSNMHHITRRLAAGKRERAIFLAIHVIRITFMH
jgi:hypothetical protein